MKYNVSKYKTPDCKNKCTSCEVWVSDDGWFSPLDVCLQCAKEDPGELLNAALGLEKQVKELYAARNLAVSESADMQEVLERIYDRINNAHTDTLHDTIHAISSDLSEVI